MDIKLSEHRTLVVYPNMIIYSGKRHSFSIGFESKLWRGDESTGINSAYRYGIHKTTKQLRASIYGDCVDRWICFPVTKNYMFCTRFTCYQKTGFSL